MTYSMTFVTVDILYTFNKMAIRYILISFVLSCVVSVGSQDCPAGAKCGCSDIFSSVNEPQVCGFCSNSEAQDLPLYVEACQLYPGGVLSQPITSDCAPTVGTSIQYETSCCQFQIGEQVMVLDQWIEEDSVLFNSPVTAYPFKCTKGDLLGCDKRGRGFTKFDGSFVPFQQCNSKGYCGFAIGTVRNNSIGISYPNPSNFAYCSYAITYDQECYPFLPQVVKGQEFVIPAMAELADGTCQVTEAPTKSPTFSPAPTITAEPTNTATSNAYGKVFGEGRILARLAIAIVWAVHW